MTPEQEEQVRRALGAAARDRGTGDGPGPVPPQVVARLDAVLADLVAERSSGASAQTAPDRSHPVDDLARRRRARRRLLPLAAAACLATIVGVTAATGGLGPLGGTSQTTADRSLTAESAPGRSPLAQVPPTAARQPFDTAAEAQPRAFGAPAGRLRTATLAQDVRRLLDGGGAAASTQGRVARTRCDQPARRPGDRLLDVRLDGRPGVLLVRAPVAGRQVAEVFGCRTSGTPLAVVTVPEPPR